MNQIWRIVIKREDDCYVRRRVFRVLDFSNPPSSEIMKVVISAVVEEGND